MNEDITYIKKYIKTFNDRRLREEYNLYTSIERPTILEYLLDQLGRIEHALNEVRTHHDKSAGPVGIGDPVAALVGILGRSLPPLIALGLVDRQQDDVVLHVVPAFTAGLHRTHLAVEFTNMVGGSRRQTAVDQDVAAFVAVEAVGEGDGEVGVVRHVMRVGVQCCAEFSFVSGNF